MFKFLKRQQSSPFRFSNLEVDLHSHLIPGIDDGAQDMEDSLELIQGLHDLGYRKLITTPHIMNDLYPNSPEVIRGGLRNVREALREAGIDVEIEAAAEYLLDEGFTQKLQAGNLLTLPGKRVLVEMSFISAPPTLNDMLFQLQTKGYRPVMAHPERYLYYAQDFDHFRRLKELGCELQVNLLSLTGYYGKPEKKTAQRLLKEGLVDFLGTDLHHIRHLRFLSEHASAIDKALGGCGFKNKELR